jgi:cytidylate kinase
MGVVTISRQFGAGGLSLGKQLADTLGYTFYDDQIIQLISEKAKVSQNWVKSIDRETGGKLQQAISSLMPKGIIDRILSGERGHLDESIYIDLLRQIIIQLADQGNAVILGRGGQYILKDRNDSFHVLLIAEKNYRIRFIEAKYKLSRASAEQIVNAEDKRRMNLYRKFERSDYDEPIHYHLILNMSKLKLDQATRIIVQMVVDQ